MGRKTPLYGLHREAGGKIVSFAGWDMPLHYGSQMAEHRSVRSAAGVFDTSHMTIVELSGAETRSFLRTLLANDVARLKAEGRALYSCMLNERGGVMDDLIVYRRGEGQYRMVVNAATRDKDLAWITDHARDFGVDVRERDDLAMLAVQGPAARDAVHACLPEHAAELGALPRFAARGIDGVLVARTGYTGEDGYELMLPADQACVLWGELLERGVTPAGLGARDTLRLEAGLNLYGSDMDEQTSPLESNLAWTVAWEPEARSFIGREALAREREQGPRRRLTGLVLEGKGVLRAGQVVHLPGLGEGVVTSGSFSPTLGVSIGLVRVPAGGDGRVEVDLRGRRVAGRLVRPPFVREGKASASLTQAAPAT